MTASPSLVRDLLCRPGAVPTQRHGRTTARHHPVGTDAIDRYLIGHALPTDPHRTPPSDQRARIDAASTISSTQLSTLMRVEFKTRS